MHGVDMVLAYRESDRFSAPSIGNHVVGSGMVEHRTDTYSRHLVAGSDAMCVMRCGADERGV